MSAPSTSPDLRPASAGRERQVPYLALTVLCALVVVLQGAWAGVFLAHDGARDASASWIAVHARGGELAIGLAAAAAVVAFVRTRDRRDLWAGAAVLTVLLVLESYLGGLIVDSGKDSLTVVHVPLAMALTGLVVWLPFRAARTV